MKLLLKLAWRNIWRNKRRSILTLSAIAFATLAAIAMRGMQLGTYAVNIKNSVNMFAGYLQIQRDGYQKNPSLNLCYKNTPQIEEAINSLPEIKGFTPRVYANGLISFEENSLGSAIFGISPTREKNVTTMISKIDEGKFFTEDDSYSIVLGRKLLQNLKASIGDDVVVLAQGFDGSMGNLKFNITGTVKTGSPEFDGMAAFIGLKTAQELLAMYGNRINATSISLYNLDDVESVREKLKRILPDEKLAVLDWQEIMPDFKQSIDLDNISGMMMLIVLIVIVAFGILNTVLMSVTERFNEFGVTLSIGIPQMKLVSLIFIETIFITIIGIIIGDIIGWGINYYILHNPIEFGSEMAPLMEEFGWLPRMESSVDFWIFLNNSILILVVSILAWIIPAYKVYKLEPLKGIRYT